jgi:hypothetical protein
MPMPVLNYSTPDSSRRVNWPLRYTIGALVVALCHLVGSLVFLKFEWKTWIWAFMAPPGRDPRVTFFVNVYEFPMAFVINHTGLVSFYPEREFVFCAVIDAAIWGMCLVGVWHFTRVIFRKRGGGKGDSLAL